MSYEYITKFTSPNFTAGTQSAKIFGLPRRILGICIHHWGDPASRPTFMGVVNYLCRKGGNTSAHTVIEAGRVASIVDHKHVAWHSGSARGNTTTIGLELNPRASNADYETAAEYIADLWLFYGKLPLSKHSDYKATKCPGQWNIYKLEKMADIYYEKKKRSQPTKSKQKTTYKVHTIKKGETLTSIAQKYNTNVTALAKLNNIKNINVIKIGQKIKI